MSLYPHRSATIPLPGNETIPGTQTFPSFLAVTVGDDPRSRDSKLSEAVHRLIPAALERRHGILVTERGGGNYTVEVDPAVPCGRIHEKRCTTN